jgi:hypothetical protein
VAAGKDGFRSEAGPWSVLATDALAMAEGTYLPDFTAYLATETVRCLQISRPAFVAAFLGGDAGGSGGGFGGGGGGGGMEAKDRANAKVSGATPRRP